MSDALKKHTRKLRARIRFLRRNVFSGISARWLKNIFGAVFAASVLACILFCTFAHSSYYNMVRDRLRADATNIEHYYSSYVATESFSGVAHRLVEEFENKDLMELQILNLNGSIAVSSSGFAPNDALSSPDVVSARGDRASLWIGRLSSKEKVMSYAAPLHDSYGNVKGTARLITTLRLTDRRLIELYILAAILAFFVILLTAVSGVFFIKSIVVPINQINDTAHAIAKGNMARRIEKYNQNDEIGALCNTINEMAAELSRTEQVKNDFISSVSHELRTPLTAIRGWSETMIAGDEPLDDTTRRGVEVIYKETERLSKLVEELLDTSRIQNGRFKLVVSPMNLVAEFEDTVFMMMERARQEDISIEYTPEHDDIEILGDKNRLKQVFFNIIDNAIKHSEKNARIRTFITLSETAVTVTVEDHGEGISPEDLPFVKEMFYKGHSQKRGSGIGLGVSDEIIKKHGGTLSIESEPGKGTTVLITLPLPETKPEEEN